MSLRVKLTVYLCLLHALLLGGLVLQRAALGWWLLVAELMLVSLWYFGYKLIQTALKPVEASVALAEIVRAREFGSRYATVGHKEIDAVLEAYNDMLSNLQSEYLRLGEQRGFLNRFLQITPVGVLIFDFEKRVSLVNDRACELLDLNVEQIMNRTLPGIQVPLAQRLAELELNVPTMVSDRFNRRLLCRRAEFHDRGFVRSYLLMEELTDELHRHERASYTRFVRVVAHEVNNAVAATNSLLSSFLGYADQIGNIDDQKDFRHALNVLIVRNRNLNDFTERVAELVKLPKPNLEETDLGELFLAMGTMFKAELERREISLDIHLQQGLPRANLDRNQMDRVMMNVIKNAIEAVDSVGHIELTASLAGEHIELSVIDDGDGLPPKAHENLFVPFYTTKAHGQGLGLSLVKEILVQHGFSYSLESELGRTRFRILMPLSNALKEGVRMPSDVIAE